MQTPDEVFGALFEAVQLGEIFPDSKTFVDAVPRKSPKAILNSFNQEKEVPDFNLSTFVHTHFDIPQVGTTTFKSDPSRDAATHCRKLWAVLMRDADETTPGASLLPLPNAYIVPGGRFGEIYYWDSYFTMLGLISSGRMVIVEQMVENFAHLIETYGHIPNGNRTYFMSRSQPPFFSLMVTLLSVVTPNRNTYEKFLPAMEKEYAFWMDGAEYNEGSHRRVVHLDDDLILNRYWDDHPAPRQESYREDVHLAQGSSRENAEIYRDLRAACESGWDFSTRWLEDPLDLATIATTRILPVDLNCLMFSIESTLEHCYRSIGAHDKLRKIEHAIDRRLRGIMRYCWDDKQRRFGDYHLDHQQLTPVESLAMVFPLCMRIATEEQAATVAKVLESNFLQAGGLLTTTVESGQQWDAPNGWAPLQWLAVLGLQNYGYSELAARCARHWLGNCQRVYQNTGKFVEKYNVTDLSLEAGGGEYPVQDGFGWTNGVFLNLLDQYGDK